MMTPSEPPTESSLAQREATWVAREKQHADHNDFLAAWQKRLEDWEVQLTEREAELNRRPVHHVMQAESGRLGAHFPED